MPLSQSLLLALTCSVLLGISACKPEKKTMGNLNIELKAKYGDQNFSLNTTQTDPAGRRVLIDKLKFYLSHITLIKTDNSEVEVKDVAFFSFESPLSLTLNVSSSEGNFKAIRFGCGLDSVQNETDPLAVPSEHPLSNDNDMAWPMIKYRFEVLEGKSDTTAGQSGTLTNPILYHIGTNTCYRQTMLPHDFSVCCGKPTTLTIYVDVKKIFYGDTQTLDIISEGTSQTSLNNPVEQAIAVKFADNFSQAFGF